MSRLFWFVLDRRMVSDRYEGFLIVIFFFLRVISLSYRKKVWKVSDIVVFSIVRLVRS